MAYFAHFRAAVTLCLLTGAASCGWGWSIHRDPAGFTADLPAGWTAQTDKASGRIDLTGREGRISILPVFSRSPLTKSQAKTTLLQSACAQWRDVQWFGNVQAAGDSALRMGGLGSREKASASFVWISTSAGTAGYLYRVSTLKAAGNESQAVLARILSSFRLTGGGGQGGAPAPVTSYSRWTDPREHAFTIETPAGWKVEGGLMRLSPLDPRGVWMTASPDGSVRVMGGDAQVPVHIIPNQTLAFSGFREGSWYSPGYGARMLVRRFVDGASFAREYVAQRIGPSCGNLSFTESRNRPDVVGALNRIYAQFGVQAQLSAGEVSFTCTQNGRLMTGYYFAGTRFTGMQGNGIWNAENLIGFVAAEGQAQTAQQVMVHILATAQLDPAWASRQQGMTKTVSDVITRTQAQMSHLLNDSYWTRHQNDSEVSRRRSNATMSVVDTVDPETGRQFRVESGSDYYWIDNAGHIAGTQTDTAPNVDFRQLAALP
jgi:hypothetical protein